MCPACAAMVATIAAGLASYRSARRGHDEVNLFERQPFSTRSATQNRRRRVKRTTIALEDPKVVSEAEWLPARLALLAKEKELTARVRP